MSIDTLTVSKRLAEHGFNAVQAEILAETLNDAIVAQAATKADIESLRVEMRTIQLQTIGTLAAVMAILAFFV